MNKSIDKRKISVIMSIYNEPEKWLRESIESILNQSFTSFEFIIINDNPKRELNRSILSEYKKTDQRIIQIDNDENIGLTKSLNKGLKIAKGKYIARIDGDDVSLPDRFNIQYSFLEKHPEYVVCGGGATKINSGNKETGRYKVPERHDDIFNYLSYNNPMIHPTLMIRKSALTANNLHYNESLQYAQDYELICKLVTFGKAYNIPQPLIYYRISKSQLSSSKFAEQAKCANYARKSFIINNFHGLSHPVTSSDFNSTRTLQAILKEIGNREKLAPSPFLKYVSLSLLTNFNCSTTPIALKSLFQKNYTFREKLKIGKVAVENLFISNK